MQNKTKQKIPIIALLVLFVITGGAAFPIYNLTKTLDTNIVSILLFLNIACYIELGILEKTLLEEWKFRRVALLNLGIILSGMLCRYLLEFGEVSNTYNFTLPNIFLHIITTFLISTMSYATAKKNRVSNSEPTA